MQILLQKILKMHKIGHFLIVYEFQFCDFFQMSRKKSKNDNYNNQKYWKLNTYIGLILRTELWQILCIFGFFGHKMHIFRDILRLNFQRIC